MLKQGVQGLQAFSFCVATVNNKHMKPTIKEIILWDVLMFYQIFLSPQVKCSAIISNKQGVYEVPHELPQDLRLRIPGNTEN